MDLFAVNQPEPDRYAIELTTRWLAVVLVSSRGAVKVGLFLDGELLQTIDGPVGQA
jgi:hypothetical protein